MSSRPAGSALVMALLLLIVLDCVAIGTLHVALQEQRIGANRALAMRLRLEAESAVRRALGHWSAAIDSMPAGSAHRLTVPAAGTGRAQVQVERLGAALFLVDAVAAEHPPRAGRSAAKLLVHPPALPPGTDPAPAPLSATGPVHVAATGVITTGAPPGCPAVPAPPHSVLTPQPHDLTSDAGARLDAPGGPLDPGSVPYHFDRIATLSAATGSAAVVVGDTIIGGSGSGLLIVVGDLTLAPGSGFSGLAIVRGAVTVLDGAEVVGAVHAGGATLVAGTIRWSPCIVDTAVEAAGLARPQPAGPRAWLPAF